MRFQIVAMLFTAIMVSFLLRSSMSMNILAMVQPSRSNTNNSTTVVADVSTNQSTKRIHAHF